MPDDKHISIKNKMKLNLILIIALILMALPMGSANVYKQGEAADIKINCFYNGDYCTSDAKCNLSVYYSNLSVILKDQVMTNQMAFFNYTLPGENTTITGDYPCTSICAESSEVDYGDCSFSITYNGKEKPSEWIIIIFMVIFIALTAGFIITLLLIIKDFGEASIDAIDLAKYIGMYLGLITVYYFSAEYLGNKLVDESLILFLKIAAVTHGVVPIFGFGYSFVIERLKQINNKRMGNG